MLCQAGGSPAGRAFGAACAETIIGSGTGVAAMKAFREDLTAWGVVRSTPLDPARIGDPGPG